MVLCLTFPEVPFLNTVIWLALIEKRFPAYSVLSDLENEASETSVKQWFTDISPMDKIDHLQDVIT